MGANSATVSYLIHYDSLLQNATDFITKWDSYFITKCDRNLLQNASGFLLQNATFLLENATVTTVITTCDNFITKCDITYYYRLIFPNGCIVREIGSLMYHSHLTILKKYGFQLKFFVAIFRKLEEINIQNWGKQRSSEIVRPFLTDISHT